MNHAIEALKRERNSIAQEAQRAATSIGNLREQLKEAEEKAKTYNASLLQLDASIKSLSASDTPSVWDASDSIRSGIAPLDFNKR